MYVCIYVFSLATTKTCSTLISIVCSRSNQKPCTWHDKKLSFRRCEPRMSTLEDALKLKGCIGVIYVGPSRNILELAKKMEATTDADFEQ